MTTEPVAAPERAQPGRRPSIRIAALVATALAVVVGASWAGADGGDGGELRSSADGTAAVRTIAVSQGSAVPSSGRTAAPAPMTAPSPSTSVSPSSAPSSAPSTAASPPPPPEPAPPPQPAPPVVSRPIPASRPARPPPPGPPATWAGGRTITAAGHVSTPAGCAASTSTADLDAFFAGRMGPVLGHDYQHVYPLGGDRYLWLFQDTFFDHAGTATRLDQASFAHNTAMVQEGSCFTLLHRGSVASPASFEVGTGERPLSRWFWPLGGELVGDQLHVVWAEMHKTADPTHPADGLGWAPARTWIGTYRASDLTRTGFRPAPDDGTDPIYGFAVSTDEQHTYLFGNSFDQNLDRQGGYFACPCSATAMYLARVPRGRLDLAPEYWTGVAWSPTAAAARPIVDRFLVENPMQPRYLGGQWMAATKVDGYWGEELVIDVATDPWGPWSTVSRERLPTRGDDRLMNTYHAHLMPWLDGGGVSISVSQNGRNMIRDAFPVPARYRLQFIHRPLVAPPALAQSATVAPPVEVTVTTNATTMASTTAATTTAAAPPPTSTPTTSSTTIAETTTTTATTIPDSTTIAASTSTAQTTTAPPPTTAGSTSLPPTTSCVSTTVVESTSTAVSTTASSSSSAPSTSTSVPEGPCP